MYETEIANLRMEVMKLETRVSMLERAVQFLLGQSIVPYVDAPPETNYADVLALKQQGKLIEAIKLYREKTNASLADAKNYVESL